MTVVGRFDHGSGRWYTDPLDTSQSFLSVTTILGETTGRSFLQDWAAKLAAEFAVDELDLIASTRASTAGRTGAVDLVKGAAKRSRERKADVGSYVHDVCEALIIDTPIPPIPDHLAGQTVEYDGEMVEITQEWADSIIEGFLNFVEDFDPVFEMAEATVVNRYPDRPGYAATLDGIYDCDDATFGDRTPGYAGTLDFIAVLRSLLTDGRPTRVLGDAKTGAHLDKTIHEQLAAYWHAEEVWLDDLGSKHRMPRVDRAVVLHLRASYSRGYKLVEATADAAAYERFLARARIVEELRAADRVTGRPLYPSLPDGSQPAPLVEDVDVPGFNPYRSKLIAAGIVRLDQLAALARADVTGIKGLGAKAPAHCETALARYGLTFADAVVVPDVVPADLLAGVAS